MSPIVLALVGCGAAAKRYYVPALKRHLRDLGGLFLVDPDIRMARDLAADLQGGSPVEDYHGLLNKVQGAIVAVPNSLHYSVTLDFLRGGAHVLCEKPLAETAVQAEQLCRCAEESGLQLLVNNTRRCFPTFLRVRDLISQGAVGDLRKIDYREGSAFAWPSATGFYVNPKLTSKGVVLDIGAHVLDTLCWWLDGRPELLSAKDDSFGGPESVARLQLRRNDCEIQVFLNRLVEFESAYTVQGDRGTLRGNVFNWSSLWLERPGQETSPVTLGLAPQTYPEFVEPIVANFVEVLAGRAQPRVSGTSVLNSLRLIDEYYEKRQRMPMPWYENLGVFNVQ